MSSPDDQEFIVLDDGDIQGFPEEHYQPLPDKILSKIQEWLEPTDYAAPFSEYGKHRASHLAGTGNWILETDQYKQWHDTEHGGLWIKAIAGAGKSVLAASLISRLMEEQVPVLYFFFRRIVSANQTPLALVRDCLSQLLLYSPELQVRLHKFVKDERRRDTVSFDELWSMLVSALTRLSLAYCVIDALDEMDTGNDTLFSRLIVLAQKKPSTIKVLMTSRPVPHVEQILRQAPLLQILLQSRLVNPDIVSYVVHRTSQWDVSEAIRVRINDTMSCKADGHFLYARLMMDELENLPSSNSSREQKLMNALDKLPIPMAEMYTQMLLEHSRRSGVPQELQLTILQWVTRAKRPLRVLELSSLIEFKQTSLGLSKDTKSVVREGCGPLLEIFEDETVHPIHHSFTEYLYDESRHQSTNNHLKFPTLTSADAHRSIALTCLLYLVSGWHHALPTEEGKQVSSKSLSIVQLKKPFLNYAMNHWSPHLRKSGSADKEIIDAMDNFLIKSPELRLVWFRLTKSLKSNGLARKADCKSIQALHVAAENGHSFYVELLFNQGRDLECLDQDARTPLALASKNGHTDTVATLLRIGAKADEPDSVGLKPLHHAANRNHFGVVTILLQAGVDPFTPKTKEYPVRTSGNVPYIEGDTPLMYACRSGHTEAVKAFIPYLDENGLQRAFYWTLLFGQHDIAMDILKLPGIDVNVVNENHTHFYLACNARNVVLMRELLERGADPHALSSDYFSHEGAGLGRHHYGRICSPLHAFAAAHINWDSPTYGTGKCDSKKLISGFELLINAGLDINSVDPSGNTILASLLSRSRVGNCKEPDLETDDVLSYLFDRGLSATSISADGSNALHLATNISATSVDILIAQGVDVNYARRKDGKTPLMSAIHNHRTKFAQILLQKGADVHIADKTGDTPLHHACHAINFHSDANRELIRKLLAAGSDVHQRNTKGQTPLHGARANLESYKVFLEYGFDLESKNKEGETILFNFAGSLYSIGFDFKTLVGLGASPLARNSNGETILHRLVSQSHLFAEGHSTIDMIRCFVELGVDPLSTDLRGNTLWHVAARLSGELHRGEPNPIFALLHEYGVSPATPNVLGQTPLHTALFQYSPPFQGGGCNILLECCEGAANVADYDYIRPLHIAASFSLELMQRLLELGADPALQTIEGQTALMIACRTRQCDIVCYLLDHFKENGLLHLVNQVDENGCNALHYASKAGRPEVVSMLLEEDAKVNLMNNKFETPLHFCAEFLEEEANWDRAASSPSTRSSRGACYVLLSDQNRPTGNRNNIMEGPSRVREIIRLLVAKGADTAFLLNPNEKFNPLDPGYMPGQFNNPLTYAISEGCEPVISEFYILLDTMLREKQSELESKIQNKDELHQRISQEIEQCRDQWNDKLSVFQNKIRFLKMQYLPQIIENVLSTNEDVFRLVEILLSEDNEPAVKEAARLGAQLSRLKVYGKSALVQMASWGFTDLMREVGQEAAQMNIRWSQEMMTKIPRLANSGLTPILNVAISRHIPNLNMIKLLISEFGLSPNELAWSGKGKNSARTLVQCLAVPSYWWHTRALEFVLNHGAELETRDDAEDTALLIALRGPVAGKHEPQHIKAVDILLRYGADANVIDKDGQTCLNVAASQSQCVKLLLDHGANPSLGKFPFILDVIMVQDFQSIRKVTATGMDLNMACMPATKEHSSFKGGNSHGKFQIRTPIYPIHLAASNLFNYPEKKPMAIKIVQMLLAAGADPFLMYEDGRSILHCLAQEGGIMEPFADLPELNMESKDPAGRTYLLAACDSRYPPLPAMDASMFSTLLENGASTLATDFCGRNALHCFLLRSNSWQNFDPDIYAHILRPFLVPWHISMRDSEGRTPIQYAMAAGCFALIDTLTRNGAEMAIPDPLDGQTALHHLAPHLVRGDDFILHNPAEAMGPEGLKYLEEQFNVDLSSHDSAGLCEFVRSHCFEAEQLVRLERQSPYRHFMDVLKLGVSIDSRDYSGETPVLKLLGSHEYLYSTDFGGVFHALKIFEAAGADLSARNNAGESILHKMANLLPSDNRYTFYQIYRQNQERQENDLTKSFQLLISKGLDITWEDDRHRTCLDVAAATGAKWMLDLCKRK